LLTKCLWRENSFWKNLTLNQLFLKEFLGNRGKNCWFPHVHVQYCFEYQYHGSECYIVKACRLIEFLIALPNYCQSFEKFQEIR
jgi:hypothetical protein